MYLLTSALLLWLPVTLQVEKEIIKQQQVHRRMFIEKVDKSKFLKKGKKGFHRRIKTLLCRVSVTSKSPFLENVIALGSRFP